MPRQATTKSKKKTEAEAIPAEAPAPRLEPDEPELSAAAQPSPDAEGETPGKAAAAITPDPEAELLAEAADTFEQAFEERLPLHPTDAVAVDAPKLKKPRAKKAKSEQPGEAVAPEKEVPAADAAEEPHPARLERLQKILSQAGIASRRHAEEMITEGRVQVNGQVVTELGSKADPERDHIRVDGKLIQGAERLRYFVLNKPKGYVTTVSDPEGRPTVMEFFKKAGERLYPVGRLDFHSEGLLLVTNDGDLANKLTKAATGVEKTYLVKVSGQPTEEELDRLREGVGIDRGRPGEGRVHTSPAIIREARSGDNPWYEVVLIEGRNRELRKIFEEIGHHVEKIRRVGYGPLVLDVEPGQFRELDADELAKLRLAAEGKWRKPKPKEPRRETGRRQPAYGDRPSNARRTGDTQPRRTEERGRAGQGIDRRPPPQPQPKREWRPPQTGTRPFQRPGTRPTERRQEFGGRDAAAWKPQRPKPTSERQGGERDGFARGAGRGVGKSGYREDKPRFDRPRLEKPRFDKPRFDKPRFDKPGFQEDRTGQRPRRGPASPQNRYEPSRPARPAPFGRREKPAAGGYRSGSAGGPQTGARNPGRPNRTPNRGPGPGRRPGGPARPPFKGSSGPSGRKPPSHPRTNSPRGRGRRPE
jgi:23S rRNA pseudouridine2605 synthase